MPRGPDSTSESPPASDWVELTVCPACGAAPLMAEANINGFLACPACKRAYPPLAQVPCILRDREAWISRWRIQATAFREMMQQAGARIETDLARFDLLPRTHARLSGFLEANRTNTEQVLALLADAQLSPHDDLPDDRRALVQEELHGAQGRLPLTHHYELLLRDWAWPTTENEQAAERITRALGAAPAQGRMLVLGAGAGRLAHDLHHHLRPEQTLLLDLDPLLVLAAQKILFGPGLPFIEFPLAPDSESRVWIEHHLRRPGEAPQGLHLVLADALHPPLAPGRFDTVVTPWLLDVIDVDARRVMGLVHTLLAPGGRWVNSGPLLYPPGRPPSQRFCPEELLELAQLAGFEIERQGIEEVRYLCSPASGHARLESVLTFVARKGSPPGAGVGMPPAWVMLPHLPVQAPPGARRTKPGHPLLREALALIDGERTLDQIAAVLRERGRIPAGVSAHDATAAHLLELHRVLGAN
ncbi:MAG: hypothetical protein AAGF11_18960 [Myxococcota bacterium]